MAILPGAKKRIAVTTASTFGTPASLIADMGLEVDSFNYARRATELTTNAVGGNTVMKTVSEKGDESPQAQIGMAAGYQDAAYHAVAQFFGADTVSAVAASYHRHRFEVDEDFNEKWLTLGAKVTTTGAIGMASCAVTRINFNAQVNQFIQMSMDLLGNELDLAPTPNTAGSLENATVDNTRRIVARPADVFAINLQGGAGLDLSGDQEDITGIEFNFEKPQEHVPEFRGLSGLGEPESAAGLPMQGTITVSFKDLATQKYFLAQEAGTEYKATFNVTGPIATGSSPYRLQIFWPRLKVVQDPSYNISSPGRNAFSVTFEVMRPATPPTGMVSVYPYLDVYNLRSASYF